MAAADKQSKVSPMSTSGGSSSTTATAAAGGDNKNTNSNRNLWETMLRDAMRRNRLPDGALVFVGPQGCGKSSLLDTFLEGSATMANPSGGAAAAAASAPAVVAPAAEKGLEGAGGGGGVGAGGGGGSSAGGAGGASVGASGSGGDSVANARGFHPVLAYSYLDATDPEEQGPEREDSPPRVSVWCCSELEFEGLMQTVLRPEQVSKTAVVIGVDLSRPWEVMEAVEKVCYDGRTMNSVVATCSRVQPAEFSVFPWLGLEGNTGGGKQGNLTRAEVERHKPASIRALEPLTSVAVDSATFANCTHEDIPSLRNKRDGHSRPAASRFDASSLVISSSIHIKHTSLPIRVDL